MKKVLFVTLPNNVSPIGNRFYTEHPYGQTQSVEWLTVVSTTNNNEKKCDRFTINDNVESGINFSNFNTVYVISQTKLIGSRTREDFMEATRLDSEIKEACQYTQSELLTITNHIFEKNIKSKKPSIVKITYQKTYDAQYDYDRLLTDFENIVNEEKVIKNLKIKKN